jgi:predicted SAM-dependent methyltransferase
MLKILNLLPQIPIYSKYGRFISSLIRNNPLFFSRKRIKTLEYLNVGCGDNMPDNFINVDFSWSQKVDICMDITKRKYPVKDNSLKGIYTEHCVEHITLDQFEQNVKEFYRMLKKGGILRIITPDGAIYFDIYEKRKNGENVKMPYEEGFITPMARINGIFRNHGHKFIFDFETAQKILEKTGFKNIRKESFKSGKDNNMLLDTEYRAFESLYVECEK